MTIKDAKRRLNAITAKANRTVRAAQRDAERVERGAKKKIDLLNKLLPAGFTPALNMEALPGQIQRNIAESGLAIIEGNVHASEFIPTPLQRQLVYDYSMFGAPLGDICLRIINPLTGRPITTGTLQNKFADEIAAGRANGNLDIAKVVHENTVGAPAEFDEEGNMTREERIPNPSILIWSSKVRLGWKDQRHVTHTHNIGVDPQMAEALQGLTDDELRTLRDISRRRSFEKTGGGR